MPVPCHLRFVYHNTDLGRTLAVPDGLRVQVVDRDQVGADDVLARGRTRQGGVHLTLKDDGERRPDIFVRVQGGGVPGLPEDWSSEQRWTREGRSGLWRQHKGQDIGTADAPVVFRLTTDCFLRLVVWNPHHQKFLAVPPGLVVEAWDLQGRGRDQRLARGRTGEDGRVHLALDNKHRQRPNLVFRTHSERRKIDPVSGDWDADGSVVLPRDWSSQNTVAVERPDHAGYWQAFRGSRVGRPGHPYTFAIGDDRPRVVRGTRARALIDGPETLAHIEDAIRGARHSVHVEMMLWFADETGERIADLLIKKAEQGVPVRVLVDQRTTETTHTLTALHGLWLRYLRRVPTEEKRRVLAHIDAEVELEKRRGAVGPLVKRMRRTANLRLRVSSFPLVFLRPPPDSDAPAAYQALAEARPWFNYARVDHRKMVVVDGKTAFLGGMNIGREYLHPTPFDPARTAEDEPFHKWHDVMVALEGPGVRPVQHLFRERWVEEGGDTFALGPRTDGVGTDPNDPNFPALSAHDNGVPVRVISTTPGARHHVHSTFLSLMDRAKQRLFISSPYVSSPEALTHVMDAAERGVRVVFIFPDHHNDSVDFHHAARLHYRELIEAGVEVYEYQGRMTHAKVLVSDDITVIGSANLNHTSFFNHYEVAAVVKDKAFTADFVRRLFDLDIGRSTRIRARHVDGLIDLNALGRLYCSAIVDRWY